VTDFLAHLDAATYESKQRRLAEMSRSHFLDLTDTRELVERLESLAVARRSPIKGA
jgi:hypothetical protein